MKFIKARYSVRFRHQVSESEGDKIIEPVLDKIEDKIEIFCEYGFFEDRENTWAVYFIIQEGTYAKCSNVLSSARKLLKDFLKDKDCDIYEDYVIRGER